MFILRSFFWKRSDTIYHSRKLSKTFLAFSQRFSSRVVRRNYLNFSSSPDIEQKVFAFFSKKMLQGYQNFILRVYRNSLKEKSSWKKVLGFSNFFRSLSKKILASYLFFSKELSKVYSTCPWEHFEEKCFSKNSLQFHFFFGVWLEKNSAFRQAFFGRFERTAFHVSIDNFWGEGFKKKFGTSFLDNNQKLSVVRTVFYVSRGTP